MSIKSCPTRVRKKNTSGYKSEHSFVGRLSKCKKFPLVESQNHLTWNLYLYKASPIQYRIKIETWMNWNKLFLKSVVEGAITVSYFLFYNKVPIWLALWLAETVCFTRKQIHRLMTVSWFSNFCFAILTNLTKFKHAWWLGQMQWKRATCLQ